METLDFPARTSSRELSLALIVSVIGHGVAMAAFAGAKPPSAVSGDRAMVVSLATVPLSEVSAPDRARRGNASSRTVSSHAAPAPTERPSMDGAAVREATGAGRDSGDTTSPGEVGSAERSPPATAARFDAAYLANPHPAYPPASRAFGEQGTVFLRVQVSVRGEPEEVTLQASSGYPRLDRAALDAVRGWRFVPARRGENAVAAAVIVPIAFSLRRAS